MDIRHITHRCNMQERCQQDTEANRDDGTELLEHRLCGEYKHEQELAHSPIDGIHHGDAGPVQCLQNGKQRALDIVEVEDGGEYFHIACLILQMKQLPSKKVTV